MGFVLFIMWILQLLIADTALAQVRVSRLVLENMVLQRGVEIKIWGWADPAEQITTEFCNQTLQWNLASPIP